MEHTAKNFDAQRCSAAVGIIESTVPFSFNSIEQVRALKGRQQVAPVFQVQLQLPWGSEHLQKRTLEPLRPRGLRVLPNTTNLPQHRRRLSQVPFLVGVMFAPSALNVNSYTWTRICDAGATAPMSTDAPNKERLGRQFLRFRLYRIWVLLTSKLSHSTTPHYMQNASFLQMTHAK